MQDDERGGAEGVDDNGRKWVAFFTHDVVTATYPLDPGCQLEQINDDGTRRIVEETPESLEDAELRRLAGAGVDIRKPDTIYDWLVMLSNFPEEMPIEVFGQGRLESADVVCMDGSGLPNDASGKEFLRAYNAGRLVVKLLTN